MRFNDEGFVNNQESTMVDKIIFLYQNQRRGIEIRYAISILAEILGVKIEVRNYVPNEVSTQTQTLVISYGKNKPKVIGESHIHIFASGFFSKSYLTLESLPQTPLIWYEELPVLYLGRSEMQEIVMKNARIVESKFDIIASTFFMVTRYEELLTDHKDQWGRYPCTKTIAHGEDFLHIPVVNAYARLLSDWILMCGMKIKETERWNGHRMATSLTCDIDHLRRYSWFSFPIKSIFRATKEKNWHRIQKLFADYLLVNLGFRVDPYNNLEVIPTLNFPDGIPWTFFVRPEYKKSKLFIPWNSGPMSPARYDVSNPNLQYRLRELFLDGVEIGLHPGFGTQDDEKRLLEQKDYFEQTLSLKVHGARQHYILWKAPVTWRLYESVGLEYDSSLTYTRAEGFRGGICTPFRPFDIESRRVLNVWELPVTLMDQQLFWHQADGEYVRQLSMEVEESTRRAFELIDTIERYRGLFNLIWHNSSLEDISYPGILDTFSGILEYLAHKDIYIDTCINILNCWRSSSISDNK